MHRDLKPGNIKLSGDAARPTVKVLDFELAVAPPGMNAARNPPERVRDSHETEVAGAEPLEGRPVALDDISSDVAPPADLRNAARV